MTPVTDLLAAAQSGDVQAVDKLFAALYEELHRIAHLQLRRNAPVTLLDTTSLVHESFLRLLKAGSLKPSDRAHFLGYSARAMRSIVVDAVRRRMTERRGGNLVHLDVDAARDVAHNPGEDEIMRVNDALNELARVDERLVRVVEMRYFAGMQEQEVADALGVSVRTVARDWEKARLFLAATIR